MKILLMRHGNTFAPGQKVVMVGGTNDLPLVERGWEQADACRVAMKKAGISPAAIYAGPLSRTRAYADRLGQGSGAPLLIEECLRELDYGPWTGLSDEEIGRLPDKAALVAWREDGVWPPTFIPGREQLMSHLAGWVAQVFKQHHPAPWIAAVTSAGILRGFLALDEAVFEQRRASRQLGFKTGHLGVLDVSATDFPRVLAWDVSPGAFEV